jgi:hypothetical protein
MSRRYEDPEYLSQYCSKRDGVATDSCNSDDDGSNQAKAGRPLTQEEHEHAIQYDAAKDMLRWALHNSESKVVLDDLMRISVQREGLISALESIYTYVEQRADRAPESSWPDYERALDSMLDDMYDRWRQPAYELER